MDFLLRSSNGLNHIGARFIAQDDASCMSISAERINSGGSVAGAHLFRLHDTAGSGRFDSRLGESAYLRPENGPA
jgi:hypothetical protein